VIYRLDFNNLYEWNNCNSVNSKLLEMVHNLVPDSLLLFISKNWRINLRILLKGALLFLSFFVYNVYEIYKNYPKNY